jgi:plastocyanin
MEEKNKGYGKRPIWQWIAIYAVIAIVIYGLIYYFIFAKKGGYSAVSPHTPNTSQSANPPISTSVAQNSIQIANMAFSPDTLTVKVGDKVTWTNQDTVGHSATADDKSFDTGVIAQGQSGSITFSKAGTYSYHCSIHPNMQAKIIVQ